MSHAGATYEGLTPGVLADDFAIESKMFHSTDNGTSGVVSWVADALFVTTPGTGASDESIQNAIDVADASGDTIHVQAGTYNESVVITKNVNLRGAGAGVDPELRDLIGALAAETTVSVTARVTWPSTS